MNARTVGALRFELRQTVALLSAARAPVLSATKEVTAGKLVEAVVRELSGGALLGALVERARLPARARNFTQRRKGATTEEGTEGEGRPDPPVFFAPLRLCAFASKFWAGDRLILLVVGSLDGPEYPGAMAMGKCWPLCCALLLLRSAPAFAEPPRTPCSADARPARLAAWPSARTSPRREVFERAARPNVVWRAKCNAPRGLP